MPEPFHFFPGVPRVESVALAVAEDEQTATREQGRKVPIVKQLLRERGGTTTDVLHSIRRVGEDQIERRTGGRQLRQRGEGVLNPDFKPRRIKLCRREVPAHKPGM